MNLNLKFLLLEIVILLEEFIGFEIGFFVFGGITVGNIICPVAFIAGAIETIVMIAKKII